MLIFDNLNKLKILSFALRNLNGVALCSKHHECGHPKKARCSASRPVQKNSKIKTQFQQLKQMFSQYWYVLIPVHIVSDGIWFGCCYYVSEQGFDVLKNLEELKIKKEFLEFMTHSDFGHLTLSFALFKVLTPFRFATTLLGTTLAIKYFSRIGLIKPAKNLFKRKKQD